MVSFRVRYYESVRLRLGCRVGFMVRIIVRVDLILDQTCI